MRESQSFKNSSSSLSLFPLTPNLAFIRVLGCLEVCFNGLVEHRVWGWYRVLGIVGEFPFPIPYAPVLQVVCGSA